MFIFCSWFICVFPFSHTASSVICMLPVQSSLRPSLSIALWWEIFMCISKYCLFAYIYQHTSHLVSNKPLHKSIRGTHLISKLGFMLAPQKSHLNVLSPWRSLICIKRHLLFLIRFKQTTQGYISSVLISVLSVWASCCSNLTSGAKPTDRFKFWVLVSHVSLFQTSYRPS